LTYNYYYYHLIKYVKEKNIFQHYYQDKHLNFLQLFCQLYFNFYKGIDWVNSVDIVYICKLIACTYIYKDMYT